MVKPLIICELKKTVGTSIRNISPRDLAQTIVGYYALVSHNLGSIVVVLSDIATSHFFKLNKIEDNPEKSLDVVWYHCNIIKPYPPEEKDHLLSFVRFNHYILDCS